MAPVVIGIAAAVCQLALALLLLAAAAHLARSALAALSLPPISPAPPPPPLPDFSTVTVQLPLRNERAVAARVLRAAAALDWPAERLQLQVLDDSDDETCQIVDGVAAELRASGASIEVIRRGSRAGFKAGALAHALCSARGDYLLVLDADSQPEPDLVRRLVGALLDDPALAFVQARWSFDNERASLLTRVQALILHGLMAVEQPLLGARRLPVQFNGTAGAWRRAALLASGGWVAAGSGDASVTEDLDISFRARLAGLTGRTLPAITVRTELPSTMAAFRAQQQRWVRGGAEVLRGLARQLARGTIPARERVTMLAHLARHARQPLLALAALWLPASLLGVLHLPLAGGVVWPALVAGLVGAVALYYGVALRNIGRSPLPAVALSPVIVALSMGMSLVLTVAFLRGFLVEKRAEFVRTPKAGGYRSRRDPLALVEVVIGAGCLAAAILAAARGEVVGGLAFAALVAAGWLWVGLASLRG